MVWQPGFSGCVHIVLYEGARVSVLDSFGRLPRVSVFLGYLQHVFVCPAGSKTFSFGPGSLLVLALGLQDAFLL